MIRKITQNQLKKALTKEEFRFVETAINSFTRLMPHIEIDVWTRANKDKKSKAWWTKINGQQRRAIGLQIFIPSINCVLESKAKRKVANDVGVAKVNRALDNTEMNLCKKIISQTTVALEHFKFTKDQTFLNQIRKDFEDTVLLSHLKEINKLEFDLSDLVEFLKQLSEQSYENKSLSFGILIDKNKGAKKGNTSFRFPQDFTDQKKFRAFTDGYRSSYLLDPKGQVMGLVDLEKRAMRSRGEHYYPMWSKNMAMSCTKGIIGFSLTRQGDILYFENGSLRFTRRFGKWQYWNHAYIIDILKNKARSQHVKPNILGKVVARLYKFSLDISFRHSGALFVILRNQSNSHELVRNGDGIFDNARSSLLKDFDKFLFDKTILGIDDNVFIELASIDGALVFSNNGYLLAYGAVVTPKMKKGMNKEEGSRSKAAIGASTYGLSIKISADGGIGVYQNAKKFIEI